MEALVLCRLTFGVRYDANLYIAYIDTFLDNGYKCFE